MLIIQKTFQPRMNDMKNNRISFECKLLPMKNFVTHRKSGNEFPIDTKNIQFFEHSLQLSLSRLASKSDILNQLFVFVS